MASWGDVQTYSDMIDDLQTFATKIQETCNILSVAAKTCVESMESDTASLQASKNVLMSVEKYEEAIALAVNLAKALSQEQKDIIEYLRTLEELDGE